MNLTNEQKNKLRKVKASGRAFDAARNVLNTKIVVSGMSGAYIQFGSDCRLYNLYEALLYADQSSEFAPGAAMEAAEAALKKIK